jgi:glycosyltransferase involved in cell wall biosynthesis
MSHSDTSRTFADYPHTLPEAATRGAHRRITIDGHAISDTTSSNDLPLVSVITPSFNSAETIGRTIESVLSQTYRNIEYIIIDGGSKDETFDIIDQYGDSISYWHSCSDKGIADAFNIGVSVSQGKLIGIVNSDDWMSPNQIEDGVKKIREASADFSFGDMLLYNGEEPLFLIKGRPDYHNKIRFGMPPINHPTVLANRAIYEKVGLFDLQWKIAMDYDWLFRAYNAGYKGAYTPKVCANMSDAGVSNTQIRLVYQETWKIARKEGLSLLIAAPLFSFRYVKTLARQGLEALIGKEKTSRVRIVTNREHEVGKKNP